MDAEKAEDFGEILKFQTPHVRDGGLQVPRKKEDAKPTSEVSDPSCSGRGTASWFLLLEVLRRP